MRKKRVRDMVTPGDLKVLAEQIGVFEAELEIKLVEIFRRYKDVERAYLPRVQYGENPEVHVALCIKFSSGNADRRVIDEAAELFYDMASKDTYLDQIPIDGDEDKFIEENCPPFYARSPDDPKI